MTEFHCGNMTLEYAPKASIGRNVFYRKHKQICPMAFLAVAFNDLKNLDAILYRNKSLCLEND